jgi:hypothetical protein
MATLGAVVIGANTHIWSEEPPPGVFRPGLSGKDGPKASELGPTPINRGLANCEYLQIDRALLNPSLCETQLIFGCKGFSRDEFHLLECE